MFGDTYLIVIFGTNFASAILTPTIPYDKTNQVIITPSIIPNLFELLM